MSMLRDSLRKPTPLARLTGNDVPETRVWGVETAIQISDSGALKNNMRWR